MSADAANNAEQLAKQQAHGRFGPLRDKLRQQFAQELPTWQRWALATTLLVDALIATGLAVLDLTLTTALLGSLLAAILLALGMANLWSLHSLLRRADSLHTHAFVAQALIAFLVLYIFETARQNPQPRPCVQVLAGVLGIVAIVWVVRLAAGARLQWSKTATTIVSLIPLAGFVQFGLQSDFVPTITAPLIDVSTTLSPIGRSGQDIQLSATAVIHNRGTRRVYVAGGLIRVMAYYLHHQRSTVTPEEVEREFDLAGGSDDVFDIDSIRPAEGELFYLKNLAGRPGSLLEPGDTDTVQQVIDIPPGIRLVRFTAVGIFFNSREIRDIKSCYNNPVSWDDPSFLKAVQAGLSVGNERVVCIDYELEPRNIIEKIVGPSPVLRVWVSVYNNHVEPPTIDYVMATGEQLRCPNYYPKPSEQAKIAYANPAVIVDESSEYAPTDKDNPQR